MDKGWEGPNMLDVCCLLCFGYLPLCVQSVGLVE